MRWGPAIVLILAALLAQAALAPAFEIRGLKPDWILVVAVFWGLYSPLHQAVFCAWILGFLADLLSLEVTGVQAFSYAAATFLAGYMKTYVFRYKLSTQVFVSLGVGLVVRSAWLIYVAWAYGLHGGWWNQWLVHVFLTALYTAGWAPILQRFLLGFRGWFGLPGGRRI